MAILDSQNCWINVIKYLDVLKAFDIKMNIFGNGGDFPLISNIL